RHQVVANAGMTVGLGVVAVTSVELLSYESAANGRIVLHVGGVVGVPVPRQNGLGCTGDLGVGQAVARSGLVDAVHLRTGQVEVEMIAHGIGNAERVVSVEYLRVQRNRVLRTVPDAGILEEGIEKSDRSSYGGIGRQAGVISDDLLS